MKTNPIYYKESPTEPLHVLLERLRNDIVTVRGKLSDCHHEWPVWKDRTDHVEGLLTCGLVALAVAVKEIREHSVKSKGGIPFSARGVGLDNCPGCYICGGIAGLYNNISGFVESKEDGETVVAMFEFGARLDYRPSEPNWIQVKIGACAKHLPNLEALANATCDGGISKSDVSASIKLTP